MTLDDFVRALKTRLAPLDNPYFHALRDGSLSREDFVETQLQFAHAVFFFSRPMLVLAGRVSSAAVRLPLLENVGDEHGRGDLSFSHEATFTRFLELLGVPKDELWSRPLWPEVRATVFLALYRGLYESRARRDRRALDGPHSVTAGFE